ncbi:PBSX family phage terminase large subunit [Ruminococcaceae bacterium OttesenSCG-928-I18]|nr:PBSX family phage terminase large subunit [Ruminococcaceae bacterium OttesenSCG-928-I18]
MQVRTLEVNPAYMPYLNDDARLQIFFGGSSSGKSHFVAQRVVMDVVQNRRNYLICRDVAKTLRNSVYNQVTKIIDAMGLRDRFVITKSEMTITYKGNGRQILFAGLDDVEKLKSITPALGVLTDVWIEEATEISYEAFKQLTKRLRGLVEDGLTKRITFTFNPITKEHWIYKEFFGGWLDDKAVYRDRNLVIVKTTYLDNHFLTADDRAALENETDRYYYEVYTLGKWGVLGKVIFRNWETQDLTERIPSFDKIHNGLDFGFSDDPNALVRVHIDQRAKTLYVFEEMYQAGMMDDQLAEELARRIGTQYVTCDCSEPKSIADLQRRGIRALSAVKGPDSINFGIRFLQGYKIIIHSGCRHFRNEIATYHWAEDKYGNALKRPVDKDNHLLDALRYALESIMHQAEAKAAKRI